MNVSETEIADLLKQYRKMTVMGLSPDASKPSHSVPLYMHQHGYQIVGTYPGTKKIGDWPIFPSLAEVPREYRKFVDVFRRSEKIPDVVDEVLEVGGVEVLWLQLGISHPDAEARAEAAGLKVVSDRCLLIEHRRWL